MEVDLIFGDAQNLHVCKRDNTEGLVDFKGIDSGQLDLGVLQSLRYSECGRSGEFGWVLLSIAPAKNLANGLQVVLLDSGFGGENKGSSAIRERRGVGRGDCAVLLED